MPGLILPFTVRSKKAMPSGNTENIGLMVSAARCLGLGYVRFRYVEEIQQQYMKVDLSTDGPFVIFLDKLRFDVGELKEQSVWVSPARVLAVVEHVGFNKALDSVKPVDKQLIELWSAALFTMSLSRDFDYYVRLVRNDPPDTEVLAINGEDRNLRGVEVEITRHGIHSEDLLDVIGKKLRKKYQKGTVLAVFVEQALDIAVSDLDDFMRTNNPFDQEVFIIGGSGTQNTFKVFPLNEISRPTATETEWMEIAVNAEEASKGYLGYEGVVFKPPGSSFLPPHPAFVKELEVRHQM